MRHRLSATYLKYTYLATSSYRGYRHMGALPLAAISSDSHHYTVMLNTWIFNRLRASFLGELETKEGRLVAIQWQTID